MFSHGGYVLGLHSPEDGQCQYMMTGMARYGEEKRKRHGCDKDRSMVIIPLLKNYQPG
jgi:hypothetical protein